MYKSQLVINKTFISMYNKISSMYIFPLKITPPFHLCHLQDISYSSLCLFHSCYKLVIDKLFKYKDAKFCCFVSSGSGIFMMLKELKKGAKCTDMRGRIKWK